MVGVEETGRASLLAGAGGVGGWPEGRIVYSRGPQDISATTDSNVLLSPKQEILINLKFPLTIFILHIFIL